MPMYLFENPETGEVIELFFYMKEEKVHIDDNNIEWKRIFTPCNLSTDAKIDPWKADDFVNKTQKKKGTMGDLMDQSAELSAQRAAENNGVDPVKEKYYKKYSKENPSVIFFGKINNKTG